MYSAGREETFLCGKRYKYQSCWSGHAYLLGQDLKVLKLVSRTAVNGQEPDRCWVPYPTRLSMASYMTRFPSNPIIIRVPFSLVFNFNKETPNKKGKRVLLGYLVDHNFANHPHEFRQSISCLNRAAKNFGLLRGGLPEIRVSQAPFWESP